MSDIGHGDYCPYNLPTGEDGEECERCQADRAETEKYMYALYRATPKPYTADEIRDCYGPDDPKRYRSLREIGEIE